jgi:hypothetical protein
VKYKSSLGEVSVLTAKSVKITVVWDIAPCSLEVDRRFRGAYCLHQGDEKSAGSTDLFIALMETARISETSVYFKEIALYYPRSPSSQLGYCAVYFGRNRPTFQHL